MADNINDENTRSYQAHERTGGGDNGKKKKMIIGGVVGAVVLVAVILIIVFATGGKPGPPGPPGPPHSNPNHPEKFAEFNPMKADDKTVVMSNYEYSVVLDNTKAKPQPTPSLLI